MNPVLIGALALAASPAMALTAPNGLGPASILIYNGGWLTLENLGNKPSGPASAGNNNQVFLGTSGSLFTPNAKTPGVVTFNPTQLLGFGVTPGSALPLFINTPAFGLGTIQAEIIGSPGRTPKPIDNEPSPFIPVAPSSFLVAFEDVSFSKSDKDYNDVFVRVTENPVPGPLPILGVGAAFAWGRKLRNRIKNSTYTM